MAQSDRRSAAETNRRPYHSPKRAQQAEHTRQRLAASARRLFARDGYGPTTIESIAADAGVSVQTFYATFGSKRAVLLSLLDRFEAEADVGTLLRAVRDSPEPRAQLHAMVAFGARLFEQAADIIAIARTAGREEPDLVELFQSGERRRRDGQAPIVRAWHRAGALRPGLATRHAADILWTMASEDVYGLLVGQCGWPVSRYQQWLEGALGDLLFA
ncbi:MAG TPA: TetR/AcrR family transcriptional regulator [Vicinamibacterales bacterium]|jgi:AcrR family transcriptional regulator